MLLKTDFKYESKVESKGIENIKPKQFRLCNYIIIRQKVAGKNHSKWLKGRFHNGKRFYSLGRKYIILIFYSHPNTTSII